MPPSDEENPFCTRHIRPGAIPFLFPPGEDADVLVERLRQNHWRGEIVGPHGSGKSALLATLIPAIERAGRSVVRVELHDGQRRLPIDLVKKGDRHLAATVFCGICDCLLGASPLFFGGARFGPDTVLIVDGYEQLSQWRRFLLSRRCRRHDVGLLVTAHASVHLPSLYRTAATPELAGRIVGQLTGGRPPLLSPAELAACLTRHGGNLREMLFDLYDLHERCK